MSALNLVILGLPQSGKSALLGALQHAAQDVDVESQFVDLSGELAKLRSVDDKYQPTRDAVAAYPIQRGSYDVFNVHDTSGVEAVGLLTGKEPITARGVLPKTIAEADGVILALDASLTPAELGAQFKQFVAFLNQWQAARSRAVKVGGLPVFIVLTKCDRMAKPGDTQGQWMQRIEEAKRKVGEQFAKALADSRQHSFGRVDVHVWATATKRPTGANEKAARAGEPYQVAELFQQVFDAAQAYRDRTQRSSQTLQGALVGLGSIAALLLLLTAWYYATQPTPDEAALENQVQTLLAGGEHSVAERVREPLEDRLKELQAVKANPAFAKLPANVQGQIDETERSIEAYKRLNAEYQKEVRNPRLSLKMADLDQIDKSLAGYDDKIKAWPDTRLAKRHEEWRQENAALKKAIGDEEAWVRTKIREGEKLRAQGGLVIAKKADAKEREAWFKAVNDFERETRRHKSNDRIAGTTIPYRVVYQFDLIESAERDWRQFKDRLEKLREEAQEK